MDNSRLDTMDILATGILNRPAPISKLPKDSILTNIEEEDSFKDLKNGLKKGGLEGNMYYGYWEIWRTVSFNPKTSKLICVYSGQLKQYRIITDEFENKLFDYALEKAEEWLIGCRG